MTPEHYHIWTRSMDGAEYGNVVMDDPSDASVTYYNIARQLVNTDFQFAIEHVVGPLQQGHAVFAGSPGFFILLAGCSGGCLSPTWN